MPVAATQVRNYFPAGSVFTASEMTDVTLYSEQSSTLEEKKEPVDPTQPNDHPILKVWQELVSLLIVSGVFQITRAFVRNYLNVVSLYGEFVLSGGWLTFWIASFSEPTLQYNDNCKFLHWLQ